MTTPALCCSRGTTPLPHSRQSPHSRLSTSRPSNSSSPLATPPPLLCTSPIPLIGQSTSRNVSRSGQSIQKIHIIDWPHSPQCSQKNIPSQIFSSIISFPTQKLIIFPALICSLINFPAFPSLINSLGSTKIYF
jgi:hypothetical protein